MVTILKNKKQIEDLLEIDYSGFKAKEVLIIFRDLKRKPLRITEPKEAYWVEKFFKYITKENFEHSIHKDCILEIKIHR